ncbi:carboxylic ester hydrolase-like [Choristoneura fumiferana]|uniref:carboxylic ester hydrolase-like n=1 Tax=Choristoneura fumiferana TaxID=7141 RepID=UPI003D157ED6
MSSGWLVVSVALACAGASLAGREARLVTTTQGPVRGYRALQGDHFEFHGIPYATVPTGAHRFMAPLPGPVWLQPLEATNNYTICPQFNRIPQTEFVIKEDCLIANVYVPDTNEKNLPVLVIVHGGAYQVGFGNMMQPRGLMESKKIVAVTFNYRLGVHGFLCLGTADAPGNAGMKDQVALLRWVKKNIGKFGGNPDDVTMAGYSAGSSSVDLLLVSKMARGLFNKVIPESGANVGAWSVQIDPLENAKMYAKELGFENVDDIYALEEFYKSASLESLASTAFLDRKDSSFVFSPCVERNTGVDIFLDDSPVNIIKQGKYKKVPVLYGFSNMEGLFRLNLFESWKDEMNSNFSMFLPIDLEFKNTEQREEVANVIKEFYFGSKPVGYDTILSYIDYFSDVIFAYPTLRSTKLQVEAGSKLIYLYEYSYPISIFSSFFKPDPIPEYLKNVRGARHVAQTDAVLDSALAPPEDGDLTEQYIKHKKVMKELWVNFVTTGKPSSEDESASKLGAWAPADAECAPHAALGERLEVRGDLLGARRRFWEDVYGRHYRHPQPPPTPPARHTEL